MTRSIPAWLIAGALLLSAVPAGSEDEWTGSSPSPETARAIEGVVGDPDPAAVQRLAGATAPPQLVAAIYRGDRAQRLAAIEACAHLPDPWPVLPYLAAVMSSQERQAASRATESLLGDLAREASAPGRCTELVPGQAAQLVEQLARIADDERLDPDIRASALSAIGMVSAIDGAPHPPDAELLEDPEDAVRGAAMAMLAPPLEESEIQPVAEMAAGDESRMLRGQASGLLCENALAHGVTAPSPDLRKLLATVVGDPASPPDAVAPVLGCLVRFAPAARADLVEAALGHPSPEVRKYWEELTQESP
jgi:hypothetical protein